MFGKMDTRGLIALIIVLTFGIMLNVLVAGAVITGRKMEPEAINAISTICGALIGVLSMYIGDKVSDSKKD